MNAQSCGPKVSYSYHWPTNEIIFCYLYNFCLSLIDIYSNMIATNTYTLYNMYYLHDWEGNMGKYSVRIGLTEGRDSTEVKKGIFPRIALLKELQ